MLERPYRLVSDSSCDAAWEQLISQRGATRRGESGREVNGVNQTGDGIKRQATGTIADVSNALIVIGQTPNGTRQEVVMKVVPKAP